VVFSPDKFSLDWTSNYFRINTCRAEAKERSCNTCFGTLPFQFFFLQIAPQGPRINSSTDVL